MRLFLYGTLLDVATLASRGGCARVAARLAPATLHGWRRAGLRGGRYPTLRRDRTAVVRGAIVIPPARVLARLTAWEGAAYRLTRVVVDTPNGKTAAYSWIAAGAIRRPWNGV